MAISPEQAKAELLRRRARAELERRRQPTSTNAGHNGVPEYAPPGVDNYNPKTGMVELTSPADKFGAFTAGVMDLPIVGPTIQNAATSASAGLSTLTSDRPYADLKRDADLNLQRLREDNPVTYLGGQVAGTIAGTAPAAMTKVGATALGITGRNIGTRMLASGGTNAGISAADATARGGDAANVATSTLAGGLVGGLIPGVGSAIGAGVGFVGDRAAPIINAITNPIREAGRRVGDAVKRDSVLAPESVLTAADEVVARQAGIPITNVDRGGETTRALARSVANQSPEARQAITKTADERFAGQGQRATEFVRKLAGGNVDDLGYQEFIRQSARAVNKPAYQAAENAPAAQSMWDADFAQLMRAPAMREAASGATERGANRAAVDGFKPIKNPFVETDGTFTLRTNPDGSKATPNLTFWDQTKRNLDGMIGKARKAGDNVYAGDLEALKNRLTSKLDSAVPQYNTARRGAAAFFDAEDALDAGRKFVRQPRGIPEAKKAYAKFSSPEKQAFQTGFASELIDGIKSTRDRVNVINNVFKSQAAREQIDLVFGSQKAKELEAYIRVEDIADKLRGAMGNSTTARQLVELGLGAGGGYAYGGGDWRYAAGGAAAAAGARYAANAAEAKVMRQIGTLLTSDDPAAVQNAVKLASQVPTYMKAVEKLGTALAVPVRGAAMTGGQ